VSGNCVGSVAIFHVWALWSELDPIGGGLGGQRIELLSHREVLGSRRDHQLPFLEHVEWSKYSKRLFAHGSQSRATPTGGPLRRLLGRFQPILERQFLDPCEMFRIIRHHGHP
jgi:hypothetical protein